MTQHPTTQPSEGAHTPGPWNWSGNWLWGGDRMILFYTTDDDGIHFSNEADRAVVLAAPDLLDALVCFLGEADAGHVTVKTDLRARAAIAKATGKEGC